jgi:Holliday junction resolvasome RuvABC DNA-binding subunit
MSAPIVLSFQEKLDQKLRQTEAAYQRFDRAGERLQIFAEPMREMNRLGYSTKEISDTLRFIARQIADDDDD